MWLRPDPARADEGIREVRYGAGRAAVVSEATGRQQTTRKTNRRTIWMTSLSKYCFSE
jgi:hypothetical protein